MATIRPFITVLVESDFTPADMPLDFEDEDLADKWVEKSVEFIKANKSNPFFLFFSLLDIHVPRIPHERFQG